MQQFCLPHYYHFILSLVFWVMLWSFRFSVLFICRLFIFDCISHAGLGFGVTEFDTQHLKFGRRRWSGPDVAAKGGSEIVLSMRVDVYFNYGCLFKHKFRTPWEKKYL